MARPHPDKMTFLEHLEELRQRLVRSCVYLALATGGCWFFHNEIFQFVIEPLRSAGFKDRLIFTAVHEAFMFNMELAFFAGIFVSAPVMLWEAWGFISPGLYKNEKAWAVPFIGMGSAFFIAGAAFGHYLLIPKAIGFLYTFGGPDTQFMPRMGEYWNFYSWFVLGIGLVFQIPVIIFVLARLGLVTPIGLLRFWKWAVLGAFIISAFITPTPDVVNQTALAAPMIGLYLIGVLVAWAFGRKRRRDDDSSSDGPDSA